MSYMLSTEYGSIVWALELRCGFLVCICSTRRLTEIICLLVCFLSILVESIQCNPHVFSDAAGALGPMTPNCARRLSDISIQSGISGLIDVLPLQAINSCTKTTLTHFLQIYFVIAKIEFCFDFYPEKLTFPRLPLLCALKYNSTTTLVFTK